MPPDDITGAAPAASTTTIEPAAAPEAIVEVSGAAAAPPVADSPSAAAAPAAAPEAPAAPAIVAHTDTPSLLATATNAEPAAEPVVEAVKEPVKEGVIEPAPIDGKPATEPASAVAQPVIEPVAFEAFTLPEGVSLAEDRVKEFTATLVNPELAPQARGQALLDMHIGAMQQYAENLAAEQHRAFGEMRAGWRTEVMADEQLGGAGHQTAMNAIARMRDLFVPEARREAFNRAMDLTGAGDHPEILRAFHAAARLFDEPAPLRDAGRPPPNNGRRPGASHGGFYDKVDSGQGPPAPR